MFEIQWLKHVMIIMANTKEQFPALFEGFAYINLFNPHNNS